MRRISHTPARATIALLLGILSACGTGGQTPEQPAPATAPGAIAPDMHAAAAHANSTRHGWLQADADFMSGMIHHHAQALDMARMAPTHGAGNQIRVLAARIINAQLDEIALMQRWLRDRNLPAPDPEAMHGEHGDHHAMHMPGMLTTEQLERLDAAQGAEFDRLFLTYMIQHHQGATEMVEQLFAAHGAGQNDAIFKIASDIGVDQTTEIERMRSMLREYMFETGTR